MLLVTHDIDEAVHLADRVVVLPSPVLRPSWRSWRSTCRAPATNSTRRPCRGSRSTGNTYSNSSALPARRSRSPRFLPHGRTRARAGRIRRKDHPTSTIRDLGTCAVALLVTARRQQRTMSVRPHSAGFPGHGVPRRWRQVAATRGGTRVGFRNVLQRGFGWLTGADQHVGARRGEGPRDTRPDAAGAAVTTSLRPTGRGCAWSAGPPAWFSTEPPVRFHLLLASKSLTNVWWNSSGWKGS